MNHKTVTLTVGEKKVVVPYGTRLSDAVSGNAPCGGHGICGKCKVIAHGELSPVGDTERSLLSESELERGVRLACLSYANGDCEIIPEKIKAAHILSESVCDIFPSAPAFEKYGVALDIGTTTLAAKLFDRKGNCLAESVRLNPQQKWGADVVSRMEAALRGDGAALADAVRKAIDSMLIALSSSACIPSQQIDGAVITGNTVMLHLLTEASVEPLSHAPFAAKRLFGETVHAGQLALHALSEDTPVYLPPCIAAFVGADTTCALLAVKADCVEKATLLADIGTNGEMALADNGLITVCSTAAGPAFEGVGIKMGMRGEEGAVDSVTLVNGKPMGHTIGHRKPRGICGSGLIDAVACLLDTGELDETGHMDSEFAVIEPPVVLVQQDIRAVQLAKSAICAGIESLLATKKITASEISSFYLAGGFGNYLNAINAVRIGLIPHELSEKVKPVGNAALSGAAMILLNSSSVAKAQKLVFRCEVLELATNPVFAEKYIENMLF